MNQNMAAAKDSSKLVALRRLSDAELASEIEKDGDAMTELVDAHMSHVHGLGGTEADSAAYYAARKRHADLQFESGRRLHASLNRGKKGKRTESAGHGGSRDEGRHRKRRRHRRA